MKAIKLSKIEWNLNGLTDEEMENAIKTLPTVKGFTAKDDFDVVSRVPEILKKKYGFEVITFSFTTCRIVDNIVDLLRLVAPDGKQDKEMFTNAGTLTAIGKRAKENLERKVKQRLMMERDGVSAYDMPKILDEVMLGIEKVGGLSWEKHTVNELMHPIYRQIWDYRCVTLKDEFEDED